MFLHEGWSMTNKKTLSEKVRAFFRGWGDSLADTYGSSKREIKDAGDKLKNRAEEKMEKGGN